jgi:hypothetical protein
MAKQAKAPAAETIDQLEACLADMKKVAASIEACTEGSTMDDSVVRVGVCVSV